MRTPIRHGEVMLVPVGSAPDGTCERVTSCIVGHSESGHHHVLDSDLEFATIVSASGTLYVDLDTPSRLLHRKDHEQHRELEVPAGTWRVVRKTEYDVRSSVDPNPRRRPVVD
ncbi:hypothetical protein [Mycolicibacterium arenosum]|uniref:Cupin n=1 Tax=Mycolicibacterium arenosum TaxID=2952157 RepID=A0ABT1MAU9_9MYCO|nr:hypothetical protein [Mycolicibacterium sp. CAU 1645]MCP9276293.1 hypothetical protein [Mycolicibacterium sp. CAU 1645]